MTGAGIEPATSSTVVRWLYHCATAPWWVVWIPIRSKKSIYFAYCSYCCQEINVSAGVTQLKLHQETKKILRTKSLQEINLRLPKIKMVYPLSTHFKLRISSSSCWDFTLLRHYWKQLFIQVLQTMIMANTN